MVDGDHDLRDALAPHARTLVEFLNSACALPAVGMPDGLACSNLVHLSRACCTASGSCAVALGDLARVMARRADRVERHGQGHRIILTMGHFR